MEAKDQGAHNAVDEIKKIDPNVPMFMGEWREEMRTTLPFKEIINKKDKIYFFRMSYDFSKQSIDSPRFLPDGTESPVKCFADMYVFIMNEDFEEVEFEKLENSSYQLLELHELYDCYLGEPIVYKPKGKKKKISEKFEATPDLKKIITGKLWPELNAFADYLKEGLRANKEQR